MPSGAPYAPHIATTIYTQKKPHLKRIQAIEPSCGRWGFSCMGYMLRANRKARVSGGNGGLALQ